MKCLHPSLMILNLKLRKVVARWVSHNLTDENRKKRVEDCHGDSKVISRL
jgi:hypothetical protein